MEKQLRIQLKLANLSYGSNMPTAIIFGGHDVVSTRIPAGRSAANHCYASSGLRTKFCWAFS